MATYTGGEGNDTISGRSGGDTILARGGNDQVSGLAGADSIDGGAGSDTLSGGAGNDTIRGGVGVGLDRDVIYGGEGNDVIESYGLATAHGGIGDDRFSGAFSFVDAGAGNDFVSTHAGQYDPSSYVSITGGDGIDTLETYGTGPDRFNLLSITTGFEILQIETEEGDSGILFDINIPASGTLFINDGDSDHAGHSLDGTRIVSGRLDVRFSGYGTVRGGELEDKIVFADSMWNTATPQASSVVYGNGGNDQIFTTGSTDFLHGGAGDDLLNGGDGIDTAIFSSAYANYSVVEISYNTFAVKDLHGSDGEDTIVDINKLQFSDQTVDVVIRGMEIIGDATAEEIAGGLQADHIDGAGGNDTLSGSGGHDQLEGGLGLDSIHGGTGNDRVYGDAGNDVLSGDSGNDLVEGGAGNDVLTAGSGADTLAGGIGDDTYVVDSSSDLIIEGADEGIDTERAAFSETLAGGLENLV
ncbi:MAG TPA: calcium-binding protein, partial [Ramlibacter sp.]